MNKIIEKNNDNLISKILNLFESPDLIEFKKEIESSKKAPKKSKNLKLFLKKYGASPINRDSCQVMLENIISALLSERQDFPLLIDIYMDTTDTLVSKCLKKHFILKNKEPKKNRKWRCFIRLY